MFLSKYISFEIKTQILLFLQKFKKDNYFSAHINNNNKKAYVFLAADYGNLGDVAITYAQTHFLQTSLPNYQIVDVPISKTLEGIIAVQKTIQRGDVITTIGGGNLGDLYDQIEFYRQLIVENFPNNKIISFPQTIDFSKSYKGEKALQKAARRYGKHEDLTFVAREQRSYETMKKAFSKNQVILTPDIVMSLDKRAPEFERKGVVLCLREDSEKLLTKDQQQVLVELVDKNFDSKIYYDTHIHKNQLTINERKEELNKIWTVFKKAELVITDRLHGMIFCYITNTPCLVFQNNNHKVKGCYEWIKDKSNTKLIQTFSSEEISCFLNDKNFGNLKYSFLYDDFAKLKKILISL